MWEREAARLRALEEQSEAAHARDQPVESAAEAQPAVLRRKMESLKLELEQVQRLYEHVSPTPQAVPSGARPLDLAVDRGTPSRYTPAPFLPVPRLKVEKPKAWAGTFVRTEREAFLKSASLYLGAHGILPTTKISEGENPEIIYTIRSFFSSEKGPGGLSPQEWFDSVRTRTPFHSFQEVANAVRLHWADDSADEVAFDAFRKAKQGSSPARVFGATVDALAAACSDRIISDLDRQSIFLAGLNPNVHDFVKTQQASRRALGVTTTSFDDLVNMAALTDGLASFKKPDKPAASSSSSSPAPRKTSGAEARPAPRSDAFARSQKWVRSALEWQKKYPEHERLTWLIKDATDLDHDIMCYNCGVMGRHISRSCTARRAKPETVIVAQFKLMVLGASSPSPSSPSLEEEASCAGQGKEGDE